MLNKTLRLGTLIFGLSSLVFAAANESMLSMPAQTPFQKININTNFAYLYRGDWNLAADVAVSDAFSLGVFWNNAHGSRNETVIMGGTTIQNDDTRSSEHQLGVTLNYYPGKTRQGDGMFLSVFAAAKMGSVRQTQLGDSWAGSYTGYAAGLSANYQFIWASGWNIQLGAGAMRIGPTQATVTSSTTGAVKQTELPGAFLSGWLPVIRINAGYAL